MPTAGEVMVIFHRGHPSRRPATTTTTVIPAAHQPMNCVKLGFPTEIGIKAALGISKGRAAAACSRPASASLIPAPGRVGEFMLPLSAGKTKTLSNASSTSRDSIAGSFESESNVITRAFMMTDDGNVRPDQTSAPRPRTRGRLRSFVAENILISQLTPANGRTTPFADPGIMDDRFLPRTTRTSDSMDSLQPTFQNLMQPDNRSVSGTDHSDRVPATMTYSARTDPSPTTSDTTTSASVDLRSLSGDDPSLRRISDQASAKAKAGHPHSKSEPTVTWSDEVDAETTARSARNERRLSMSSRHSQTNKKVMLVTAKLRQRETQDSKLATMLFRLHRQKQKVEKENRDRSPSPTQPKRRFSAVLPRSTSSTPGPSSPSGRRRSSVTPTFAKLLRSQSRTNDSEAEVASNSRRTSFSASSMSGSLTMDQIEPTVTKPSSSKHERALTRQKNLRFLEPPKTFVDVPEKRPLTVCMDYPGTSLNHQYVKHAVEQALQGHPGARVTRVQFEARNVVLGTSWAENRWLVTVNKELPFRLLLVRGVKFRGDHVRCRAYDDVIQDEYEKYLKASGASKIRTPPPPPPPPPEYIQVPSVEEDPMHRLAKSLPVIETTVH